MPDSKVVQLFFRKKMMEEHCSVHSITIGKGRNCIVPLNLTFGIKGRLMPNIKPCHFTPR
jgi:hypothetical protein